MADDLEVELELRLLKVEQTIEAAALRSGRKPETITLLSVSKGQPLSKMLALQRCVQRRDKEVVFGENYVQEYKKKKDELKAPYGVHLIGPLQSNKAKEAIKLFDVIESVHSAQIAKVLDAEARKQAKKQRVYLQVNISSDSAKSGFDPSTLIPFVVDEFPKFENLELKGLMTITRLYEKREDVRPDFRRLKELAEKLPFPLELSMGMSQDYDIAIEEGATVVRVGSALFGERVG